MKPWKFGSTSGSADGLLRLGRMRRRGEGVVHGAEEPRLVEGLDQEVEGAGAHRLHRAVDRAVGGDHDDPRVRRVAAERLQQLEAVAVGKLQVEQHHVRAHRLALRPRLGQAEGADHVVAGAGQHRLVDHGERGGVLDQEQAIRHPPRPPQPAARRSRAKAMAASISPMQRRVAAAMRSVASVWASAFRSRAQFCSRTAPSAPATEIRMCEAERIGARVDASSAAASSCLRREKVGDHLVEQLGHGVCADRLAERVVDGEVDHWIRIPGARLLVGGRRDGADSRDMRREAARPAPRRW